MTITNVDYHEEDGDGDHCFGIVFLIFVVDIIFGPTLKNSSIIPKIAIMFVSINRPNNFLDISFDRIPSLSTRQVIQIMFT